MDIDSTQSEQAVGNSPGPGAASDCQRGSGEVSGGQKREGRGGEGAQHLVQEAEENLEGEWAAHSR